MTNKKKEQDKRVWKRMGFELAILERWISAIQSDPDYNEVADRKTWERWLEIISRLDTIRARCESRMAEKINDWSSEIFFPEAYTPAVIEQIVQGLRRGIKRPNRRSKGVRCSGPENLQRTYNEYSERD